MNFDRLARHYRWLETVAFGNALQNARTYWINEIPRPTRALILGEGNGRFLSELLRAHPKINIDCVDASGRMLELARARVRRLRPESLASVRFLHLNILNWSPSDSYDLLVTHFFLDCFPAEQIEAIIAKLAQAAQSNAVWLIADFALPKEFLARAHASFWLRVMYAFFHLTAQLKTTRLVDPRGYLETAGFTRISTRSFRWRMLQTDFYSRQLCSPLVRRREAPDLHLP